MRILTLCIPGLRLLGNADCVTQDGLPCTVLRCFSGHTL